MTAQKQQARPWWKEPWPWLLMSGPLLAILGCGVTIWLASAHADVPIMNATRHGLVVEKIEESHARHAERADDNAPRRP